MVTIPTGSIVGVALLALVVGIIVGRSSRVMDRIGRAHAAAHGGAATGGDASAAGGHSDVRVQTVVVAPGDSATLPHGVEVARRAVDAGTVERSTGASVRGELVEGQPDLNGWGDWHEHGQVTA